MVSSWIAPDFVRSLSEPCSRAICPTSVAVGASSAGCSWRSGSDAAGVFYPDSSGAPNYAADSEVTGVPGNSPSFVYDDSIEYVFGVSDEGLRSMADEHYLDPADFPSPIAQGSVTVVDVPGQTLTFGPKHPLDGDGIVVVNGDVTIDPGSSSFFGGLLYVNGNLTVHAPVQISGAVIATGTVAVEGTGDFADIVYDDEAVKAVQESVASYRMSRAARRVLRSTN